MERRCGYRNVARVDEPGRTQEGLDYFPKPPESDRPRHQLLQAVPLLPVWEQLPPKRCLLPPHGTYGLGGNANPCHRADTMLLWPGLSYTSVTGA